MNTTFQICAESVAETPAKEFPFVSVIMPVFNEENFIERSLVAVLEQDYPRDRLEIIIADGMSSDQTREIVGFVQNQFQNIRLIDNPARIVPTGLNRAIACARGDIIVRLDGHCEYPKDYVRRVVELRQQLGADTVGGVLVPLGTTYVGKSVAAAYYSPVGLGGTALKAAEVSERIREVDTVHGGCWKRERLLGIGGFDEEMVRNQDDELSFRLRKNRGTIFQTLAIPVKYHVRDSFKKLFLQFTQYGYWKVRVVRKHPQQASARHFAPALFVLTILAAAILGLFFHVALWAFAGLIGGYLGILASVSLIQVLGFGHALRVTDPRSVEKGRARHSVRAASANVKDGAQRTDAPYHNPIFQTQSSEIKLWPGIIFALMTIHFGYGIGFVLGCARVCLGRLPTDKIFERVTR
jgi:succinoglycan biosynthesis protein ExoA